MEEQPKEGVAELNSMIEKILRIEPDEDIRSREVKETARRGLEEWQARGKRFKQLTAICESMCEGIVFHKEGEILFANRRAAIMLGFGSPEDLSGKNLFALVDIVDHPLIKEMFKPPRSSQEMVKFMSPEGESLVLKIWGAETEYEGEPVRITYLADPMWECSNLWECPARENTKHEETGSTNRLPDDGRQ